MPGDIVLVSRAPSAYGYFSHVTAVATRGRIIGHNVLFGIFMSDLDALVHYDHIRVVRPRLDEEARARAAAFMESLQGTVFNLFAVKNDPYRWHCAKSVWKAYHREGIDLAPDRAFVIPDDIAASAHLELVREWRHGK